MKYLAAALFVLGLGLTTGAATQDWIPMMLAQSALGLLTFASSVMVAGLIDLDKE